MMQFSEFDRRTLIPQHGFVKERVRPVDIWVPRPDNPFWGKSVKQPVFPCAEGVVYDRLHSFRILARCGKWICEYCGDVKTRALQSEIQVLRERHGGLPVFTVLTFKTSKSGRVKAKGKGYLSDESVKAVIRRWCSLASKITGTKAYFKGFEPFKSGAPHCNIMWFGVRKDFTSCPIKDRKTKKYDMRLQCGVCDACELRGLWTSITGAERSTHVVATGNTASYVTKYLTKTHMEEFDGFFDRFRRYSFSRSCKRSPSILPVYRYIGNWLRSSELWQFGVKKHKADRRGEDYLTDYFVFTGNETEYERFKPEKWSGYMHERSICSEKHEMLCDPVPYWSPTRIRAWGGAEEVWDWVARKWGEDTRQMLIQKIKTVFRRYEGRLLHDGSKY